MEIAELPQVDEHATLIAAGVDDVWPALLSTVDRAFSRRVAALYARAVGCTDHTSAGPRPLAPGSTIPGFRVVAAVPGRELVLEGRHRYSSYALIFRLDALGAHRSQLRAESRADFPGVGGGSTACSSLARVATSPGCVACSTPSGAPPSNRRGERHGSSHAASTSALPGWHASAPRLPRRRSGSPGRQRENAPPVRRCGDCSVGQPADGPEPTLTWAGALGAGEENRTPVLSLGS